MMKMEDLGKIAEGWKNLIFETQEVENIALPRLEICSKCPFLEGNLVPTCGKCGCVLAAKSRSLSSKCPENKW